MTYSFRIYRIEDAKVMFECFRAFRAETIGTLFAMFKSRVAREKAPRDAGETEGS
jgi:hypothetical protein